jgi:DNA-binding MltR family transcriptional regulator
VAVIGESTVNNALGLFEMAKHIHDKKIEMNVKKDIKDTSVALNVNDPIINNPILSAVKEAALNDIFRPPQKSLRHGGPVTRSAIVRNGLEKGIESRKSLGIDKRKSGESSIKERRSLISVFS